MASLCLVFDLLSCCVSLTMHSGLRLPEPDPSLAFPSVAGLRVWSWARPLQYGRRDFTVGDLRRGWDIIRSEDTMDTSFKYIDWKKKVFLTKECHLRFWCVILWTGVFPVPDLSVFLPMGMGVGMGKTVVEFVSEGLGSSKPLGQHWHTLVQGV